MAVVDGDVVAVHDDISVLKKFLKDESIEEFEIIKVKRKKIPKIISYDHLYLVRYGDRYLPYGLYDTMKSMDDQSTYDLKYCMEILYRLLETSERDKKDTKAIMKTIRIIMEELESDPYVDLDVLKEIKKMDERYRERIW